MSVYSSFRSGVSSLTAGTGTAISTSTGNVVIWNTSGGGGIDGGSANTVYSPSEANIDGGYASSTYPSN